MKMSDVIPGICSQDGEYKWMNAEAGQWDIVSLFHFSFYFCLCLTFFIIKSFESYREEEKEIALGLTFHLTLPTAPAKY